MQEIYFDNSATTRPCSEAVEASVKALEELWGNPSSLHKRGNEAARLLLNSRNEIIKAIIGCKAAMALPRYPGFKSGGGTGTLIFTGSGTESDNLAINGTLKASKNKKRRVITTDSEHPAVLETLSAAEEEGVEVYRLSTASGVVNLQELEAAVTPDTVLITVMHVNNETGAVYDIPRIFSIARSLAPGVICHTDCVQSFQKLSIDPSSLNADMITISGHKVHGPKGIGALWISDAMVRKRLPLPVTTGGGQENGYRSGTENLPGIAGFAAAVAANGGENSYCDFLRITSALRETIIKNLPTGIRVNTPAGKYVPNILSLTLPVPKSQPMLNFLSARGIYISSGSACSSHKNTVSRTLTAFGLSHEEADRTVRVSLDASNTESEAILFCKALGEGIEKLRGK